MVKKTIQHRPGPPADGNPRPAALLILFKTYFDYRAHRVEHGFNNQPEE